jgi:cellulose synthase/poly-beta-1,6-N-acetylglucosamine synthase-like glycosyltransferase
MSVDVLIYPFIFLAIFFESFLLVTFLSKPARETRSLLGLESSLTPDVAIIVSCWNEETTIAGTVESLLALDYPTEKLSLILVNDGSTDNTPHVLDRYARHPQITVLHKENGGKFTAMNLGLTYAENVELVGFLDADSFVAPDALREIVATFTSEEIKAATASMSIHQPRTLIQRMQSAEYLLAISVRHVFASLNGLYVTPGPFSFYRREIFTELGLFKHAYLAEDMEMAMRLQRANYKISNAIRARVYTKGPSSFQKLIKQRVRWTTGFLRNILFEYRDLIGVQKNPVLGAFVLPLALVSIVAGIFVFIVSASQIIQSTWHTITVAKTVPISYTIAWQPFSWYYMPVTTLTLLGLVLFAMTIAWIVVGKQYSKTPGNIVFNLIAYFMLYWLIAPLWLIRSVSDVAFGTRTTWR